MTTVDSTGLTIDSFAEVLEGFNSRLSAAFGPVDTESESPIGQFNETTAYAWRFVLEGLQSAVSAFSPYTATGTRLDRTSALWGLSRYPESYSTAVVTMTATSVGCTIPAGTVVKDVNGVSWETDDELVLGSSGSGIVGVTCLTAGRVPAPTGSLTEKGEALYGWSSVTNAAPASLGRAAESDSELRRRLLIVINGTRGSSVPAIYQKVTEVTNVTDVNIKVNLGIATDDYGIVPGGIWVIVVGGTDNDVASALFNIISPKSLVGSTKVSYTDPTINRAYDIRFSRGVAKNVYVSVDIQKNSEFPGNGVDLVKAKIIEHIDSLGLERPVVHAKLQSEIFDVDSSIIDVDVKMDFFVSPLTETNLYMEPDEYSYTESSFIGVTVHD